MQLLLNESSSVAWNSELRGFFVWFINQQNRTFAPHSIFLIIYHIHPNLHASQSIARLHSERLLFSPYYKRANVAGKKNILLNCANCFLKDKCSTHRNVILICKYHQWLYFCAPNCMSSILDPVFRVLIHML